MRLHLSSMIPAAAVVAFALVAGQAASLYAEAIDLRAVAATAVTASSYYSEGAPNEGLPMHASDWSGMTGAFPDGVASTTWYTSWASEYHDPPDFLHEWIQWDLGGTYTLSKVHVWNFNEGGYTDQGIKTLDIQKWNSETSAWENAYTGLTWSQAPGSDTYAGFDQDFTTPITTSKIRFANLVNYGSVYGAGVGEVVFYGVPEPGTLGLLGMAGLGLLAYAWRRRRS